MGKIMKASAVLLSAALSSTGLLAADGLSDGLVSWFSFDRLDADGKVENLADPSRPMTLFGTAALTNDAVFGSMTLALPGEADDMGVFESPALTNQTLALWVRRDKTDGPHSTEQAIALPCLVSEWGAVRIHYSAANLDLSVIGNANEVLASVRDGFADRQVWSHYVFAIREIARAGGKSTVETAAYLDGKLFARATLTQKTTHGRAGVSFTRLGNFDPRRPVRVRVDEVRAWRRALSADEAAAEFERARAGRITGLIGYWNMDRIETDADGTPFVADLSDCDSKLMLGSAVAVTNDAVEGAALAFVNDPTSLARATLRGPVSDISYALWVKPKRESAATAPRLFAGMDEFRVSGGKDDYNATVSVYGGTPQPLSGVTEPWCLAKGQWSHFALVVRRSGEAGAYKAGFDLYVNGQKTSSREGIPVSRLYHTSTNLVLFGLGSLETPRPVEALGDEVRIYKRALTADEVRKVWAGTARVDAGRDFSTASESAVLNGFVSATAGGPLRRGYAGDVSWSLVAGPEGGAAAILRPTSPETEVVLPVPGAYAFRLSASAEGFVRSDDVVVTRLAAPSGSLPVVTAEASPAVVLPAAGLVRATCDDASARISWRKKSGPGGVWIEPVGATAAAVRFSEEGTYVLVCSAENGAGAATADVTVSVSGPPGEPVALDDGLERHWGLNANPLFTEPKTGKSFVSAVNGTDFGCVPGVWQYGFRALRAFTAFADGGAYWETRGDGYVITSPGYLSASLWMYYDPEGAPFESAAPFLVCRAQALALRFGKVAHENGGLTVKGEGLTLCQEGAGARKVAMTCDFDGLLPVRRRWVHVAAVWDRAGGLRDNFELWVDGVRRVLTPVSGLSDFPRPGRDIGNSLTLAGTKYGQSFFQAANMGVFANLTNEAGEVVSAVFPGAMDEVRLYSRRLNAAEIRALATEFSGQENLAPALDAPLPVTARLRVPCRMALGAFDDGRPVGGALSYHWRVLSGDATRVSISDPDSPTTDMTFARRGDYVLQLTVSDGERTSASAPIAVSVPPNGLCVIVR